jgi:hypothetical protein
MSAALAGAVVAGPGCGGNSCGAMGAPTYGLTASGSGAQGTTIALTFGALQSSANNDCPAPNAPHGVVSLTIEATEMGSGSGNFQLCIPRPDELETQPQALGATGGSDAQFQGLFAADATCSYMLDTTMTPSGTIKAEHECNDGTNKAGFALEIDGTLPVIQTCTSLGTTTSVSVTLAGTTAVVPGNF